MSKEFKKYLPVWVLLFALLNILAWVPPFKRNEMFYTIYGLSAGSFAVQLLIVFLAFRNKNRSVSYPIFIYSIVGLVMLFAADYYFIRDCYKNYIRIEPWMFIVVDAIVLALHYVFLVSMSTSLNKNVERDEHFNEKTDMMRSLTEQARILYKSTNNQDINRVYDALRFSNKTIRPESKELIKTITEKFELLRSETNDQIIKETSDQLISLINRL